jgi:hypothetical protein
MVYDDRERSRMSGGGEEKKRGIISRLTDALFEEVDRERMPGRGTFSPAQGEPAILSGRLLEQIEAEVERAGAELVKFLELVESFVDIIPEEQKRYSAALKAFTHASGLTREDVIKAADRQLEEVARQKGGFSKRLAKWQGELKVLQARAGEVRGQIGRLEERVRELEAEEKRILEVVAAGEKEAAEAEGKFDDMAEDLARRIRWVKGKIEGRGEGESSEKAAPRAETADVRAPTPVPPAENEPAAEPPPDAYVGEVKNPMAGEGTAGEKRRKPCPDCGGELNWYAAERKWMCYACAHEEDG